MLLQEFLETTIVLQLICIHSPNLQIIFEIGASCCLRIINHPCNPWSYSLKLLDAPFWNWISL